MKSWWILYFRAEIVHSLDDFCSIKLLFLLYPGMCPLWGCVSWLVVYSFAPLDLPLPQVTVLYNLAHVTECSAGGGQVCNCQAFLPDIFACHCIMNRGGVEISLNFRWGVHSKQSHLDDVIWPDAPSPIWLVLTTQPPGMSSTCMLMCDVLVHNYSLFNSINNHGSYRIMCKW